MVANRTRYGTTRANARGGVINSSAAPTRPPATDGPTSMSIHRLLSPSSRLKPNIPPSDPGHSDTVLVTFAWIGLTPTQIRAGKLTSVPPPATELIMPAR